MQRAMPEPHERAGFALLRFGPTGEERLAIAADVAVESGHIVDIGRLDGAQAAQELGLPLGGELIRFMEGDVAQDYSVH